jgi:hypothetical protein
MFKTKVSREQVRTLYYQGLDDESIAKTLNCKKCTVEKIRQQELRLLRKNSGYYFDKPRKLIYKRYRNKIVSGLILLTGPIMKKLFPYEMAENRNEEITYTIVQHPNSIEIKFVKKRLCHSF